MAFTANKNLEQPALGSNINTWYTPLNNNFANIDTAFSGKTTITGLASSTRALTQAELIPSQIFLQGTLTANIIVTIPAGSGKIAGSWVFYNQTTGAFGITLQNSDPATPTVPAGATVSLPQGVTSTVYSDGTNVYFADNRPLGVPTGGAGDAIFFVNSQTITTNYSIPVGYNAVTAGPVTVNSGATVTIPSGSTWAVV